MCVCVCVGAKTHTYTYIYTYVHTHRKTVRQTDTYHTHCGCISDQPGIDVKLPEVCSGGLSLLKL